MTSALEFMSQGFNRRAAGVDLELERAKQTVSEARADYDAWARIGGELTREERGDKARAFARLETARSLVARIEARR